MKVIFLDFDGVITTLNSKYKLDPDKMALIGRILEATGAKIVISSSWRRHTLEDTIKEITDASKVNVGGNPFPYPDAVVGVTERMYSFSYPNNDRHFGLPRGVEIQHYIDTHKEVEQYVILDDDCDMLLCQADNFIHTDTYEGISELDAEKAIVILNRNDKEKDKTD